MNADTLKKVDNIIGTPLCTLFGFLDTLVCRFRNKPDFSQVERILIIKTVAIGDIVVALPTIKAIRETYPNAHIAFLATPRVKEVLRGCPYLDEVIYYDVLGKERGIKGIFSLFRRIRQKRFDMIIELEHYYRFTTLLSYFSGAAIRVGFDLPGQGRRLLFTHKVKYPVQKHEVEAFLELAKAVGFDWDPARNGMIPMIPLFTSPEDKRIVREFLLKNDIKNDDLVIVIHPATSPVAKSRRWMNNRFAKLADELKQKYNAKIIFTGSPDDTELVNDIAGKMKTTPVIAAGKISLKQFAYLAAKSKLFIGVDTGTLHIAAAAGTRVIGLYGPNTPEKWGPYGAGNIAIYKALPCSPCTKQYMGIVSRCKKDDCMRAITVDDVIKEVDAIGL